MEISSLLVKTLTWYVLQTHLVNYTTRMKIRESVVSSSFNFPHPPEDQKKKKKHPSTWMNQILSERNSEPSGERSGLQPQPSLFLQMSTAVGATRVTSTKNREKKKSTRSCIKLSYVRSYLVFFYHTRWYCIGITGPRVRQHGPFGPHTAGYCRYVPHV